MIYLFARNERMKASLKKVLRLKWIFSSYHHSFLKSIGKNKIKLSKVTNFEKIRTIEIRFSMLKNSDHINNASTTSKNVTREGGIYDTSRLKRTFIIKKPMNHSVWLCRINVRVWRYKFSKLCTHKIFHYQWLPLKNLAVAQTII